MKSLKNIITLFIGFIVISCLLSCTNKDISQTVTIGSPTITIDKTVLELTVGEKYTLTATLTPQSAEEIFWMSSDPSIASISSGQVTALKEGTTKIIASAAGVSATCIVTVIGAPGKLLKKIEAIGSYKTSSGENYRVWMKGLFEYNEEDELCFNDITSYDGDDGYFLYRAIIDHTDASNELLISEDSFSSTGLWEDVEYIDRNEYSLLYNGSRQIKMASDNTCPQCDFVFDYDTQGKVTTEHLWSWHYNDDAQVLEEDTMKNSYKDGNLVSVSIDNEDGITNVTLEYGEQSAVIDPSFMYFGLTHNMALRYAIYLINGFPGNKNLPVSFSSESGGDAATTGSWSYVIDENGYVTELKYNRGDGCIDYYFTYVDSGTQDYVYETPFVTSGMGGTTWKYSENGKNWYLVFVDASKFYLVEPYSDYQEMIAGTYVQTDTAITLSLRQQETECTLAGTKITATGGYIENKTFTKTDNFIF